MKINNEITKSKSIRHEEIEQDRGERNAEKEVRPYKYSRLSKIPAVIKAVIIKYWFAGAIYFFIGWGIPYNTIDQLDVMAGLGLAIGLVTDVIVNKILILLDDDKNKMRKYIMFSKKKIYSILINLIYGLVLSVFISYTYSYINVLVINIKNLPKESVVLPVEPLLYGLFFLIYDFLFLTIRNLIFFKKYFKKGEFQDV
jgi:hypothetical protein